VGEVLCLQAQPTPHWQRANPQDGFEILGGEFHKKAWLVRVQLKRIKPFP
jgi:hypothetical protein